MPSGPAYDTIAALLARYGLSSLTGWAWDQLTSGRSPDEVQLALRDTSEFRGRFRGLFDREAAGLPPISVDEYLQYEDQAFQMMREFGYPPGFYDDPDDFANLIGRNVSINELQQRLSSYADVAAVGREQYRTELARHFQGGGIADAVDELTDGELAAVMIDPDRGLPVIRQRLAAAGVSAGAVGAGFGSLSFAEASRLAGVGLEEGAARQAFGELASQGDVTGALAGEEAGLSRETQLGVVAGEAAAVADLERRRRQRQGAFGGGGGFSTSGEGVGGVGSAR